MSLCWGEGVFRGDACLRRELCRDHSVYTMPRRSISTTIGKFSQQDTHISEPDENTNSPSLQIYPSGTTSVGCPCRHTSFCIAQWLGIRPLYERSIPIGGQFYSLSEPNALIFISMSLYDSVVSLFVVNVFALFSRY